MKILEEFTIEEKRYICIQKIIIDSEMYYICKDMELDIKVYFKEDENGKIEETKDENIKSKIEKLIYSKSKDVSH